MKAVIYFLIALIPIICSSSMLFQQDLREEYRRKQQQALEEFRREQDLLFEEYRRADSLAYAEFMRADSLAHAEFRASVEGRWDEFSESTKKKWVEYSGDLDARTEVDFEKGEVKVEVLVESPDDRSPMEGIPQKLAEAVEGLVRERGKTMDYSVRDQQPEPLGPQPVLEGQLVDKKGDEVTPGKARDFAREVIESVSPTTKKVVGKDGKTRIQAMVVIPLVPHHLRVRAERFVKTVQAFASRYELDSRLVLAVIHTESYFNPKAKSHVPAYGLMQLVPTSGGLEAYYQVHGKQAGMKCVSPNYLLDAKNNIELGCAYLHRLMTHYFGKVNDLQSKHYCAICAYNTGPGNVSRAISGRKNLDEAVAILNGMNAEDVFRKLKKDLPYQETRDYIVRVLERVGLYDEWKN